MGFYNNSFFNSIYNNILVSGIAHTFCLGVFFGKVGIKKSMLAPIGFKIVGIGGLIYVNLIGPKGFYGEVFRQKLAIAM